MKTFLQKIIFIFAAVVLLFQYPTPARAGNPPDQGHSRMDVSSTGTVTANGQSIFTITITLRDSNGNILTGGDTIELTVSDPAANIGPTLTQQLNNAGQATFTVSSNNPGTDTIGIIDIATGNTTFTLGSIIFAPTPTSQPTPTPFGTCNDAIPAAPQIVSADSSGAHSIVLTWNAVAAPVSYYLVSYGVSPGNYIYGNPNVGNVTSYIIGSLSTGKTYYFVVKAVNGCMPGAYSNEMTGVAGVSTPTPTTWETSGIDVSPTDQTTQSDLTNGSTSSTPTPTEGPPITPVPKAGGVGAGRMVVYSVIGALLLASVVVLIIVNKTSRKPKKPLPPTTPFEPPSFDSDQSNSFNEPQDKPPISNFS